MSDGKVTATPRRYRVKGVNSPLINPDTPIHALASGFQNYMHIPDPMVLYATMGAVAGMMLSGEPIWLMLVGDSGGGKTKILKSLSQTEGMRQIASISGESAFISGTSKKERAPGATGGLLKELGDNAALLFMDFTTVLSKDKAKIDNFLGMLREIYDKTWSRDMGTDGGRKVEHRGRVNLLAGVTHTIDRHDAVGGEMGQRTLYFRLPHTDGYQEGMSAVDDVLPDDSTTAMQAMVNSLFYSLSLTMAEPKQRRKLSTREKDKIVRMGMLGATMRNTIPRSYDKREIIDLPTHEVATRISKQFAQLYCGMEAVGVSEEDRWVVLEKIMLDIMPRLRLAAMRVVIAAVTEKRKVTTSSIARELKMSQTTIQRVMEDLDIVGVVERVRRVDITKDDNPGWRLSEWAEERFVPAVEDVEDVG